METDVNEMGKPRHAVSTCSPDCPTESAVERALVDLECRREAAGKRNGDTHRVNTEVPDRMPQSKGNAATAPWATLSHEKKWCYI